MDAIVQDLRFAVRQLVKRPGFAVVTMLTLALGIGANTAIFSAMSAVVMRPLDYPEPDRLFAVWPERDFSKEELIRLREESTSGGAIAAYSGGGVAVTGAGEPELVLAPSVTAEFFGVLGTPPAAGRYFLAGDDAPGAERVVVLDHGLWQRKFGSEPEVVGRTLELDGVRHTIVGVMPAGFEFLQNDAGLATPLILDPAEADFTDARYLHLVGRLRSGVTPRQAAAEVRSIALRWSASGHISETSAAGAGVVGLREHLVGDLRRMLLVLMGAVGLILLIACANVGSLMLARGADRRGELALRSALGAGRPRLLRQLTTEGLLLSLLGGGAGVLGALWAVPALVSILPPELPRLSEVAVDARVLAFALALSIVTGAVATLWPAARASRLTPGEALRERAGRALAGGRPALARRLLVVGEIALAMVLVIGAGLMVRSFASLHRVDPGFEPQGTIALGLLPSAHAYPGEEELSRYFERTLAEVQAAPGVQAAGAVQTLPVGGGGWVMDLSVEGRPPEFTGEQPLALWRVVTADYLRTIGARLVSGRPLMESDRSDAPQVAVVNETMAERFWPGEDPIGRRFRMGFEGLPEWVTIVGVMEDIRERGLSRPPDPVAYRPYAQAGGALHRVGARQMSIVARTSGEPEASLAILRERIWSVDPNVPIFRALPMERIIGQTIVETRAVTLLLVLFGAVALLLGAVGIFGVMSHLVARRTAEIGIRRALGARSVDILKLVAGQGTGLAVAGLLLGIAGAIALTRFMEGLLFEVRPTDAITFGAVAILLGAVALLAIAVPLRSATRVDPMVALRHEGGGRNR